MSSAGTSHAVKCCFVAIFFPNEQVTVAVPYPSHATAFFCLRKYPVTIISKIPRLFSTFIKLESTSPIITLLMGVQMPGAALDRHLITDFAANVLVRATARQGLYWWCYGGTVVNIHVILKSLHHHWCWDGWKGYYSTFLFLADLRARRISQTKIINIVNYPILSLLGI